MLLMFFLAWVIFNGRITLEIVLFGAVISAAMLAFVCHFMDYSLQKEWNFYRKAPLFGRYVLLLVKEIVKANIAVFRLILTRKEEIEPVLVKVATDLRTETCRVLLANSITLTPGTITVSVTERELLVHCLDKSLAQGMEDSQFVMLLKKMEEEAQ